MVCRNCSSLILGSSTTRPISRNYSTFWLVAVAFVRRNSSSSRPARDRIGKTAIENVHKLVGNLLHGVAQKGGYDRITPCRRQTHSAWLVALLPICAKNLSRLGLIVERPHSVTPNSRYC